MEPDDKWECAPASSSKIPMLQHADITVVGNKEGVNIHESAKRPLGCRSLKRDKKEGKADNFIS